MGHEWIAQKVSNSHCFSSTKSFKFTKKVIGLKWITSAQRYQEGHVNDRLNGLTSKYYVSGFQPAEGRLPCFLGSRELLIKIFIITSRFIYFVYGNTFCRSQNNRITWHWHLAKMIAYCFIKNCSKYGCDHYNFWVWLWTLQYCCVWQCTNNFAT